MSETVKVIRLGGLLYRLPFADLIRPLNKREAAGLTESITRRRRVLTRVVTYDSPTWGDRCVIDGANRLRIVSEMEHPIDIPVQHRGPMSDDDARIECLDLNIDRRHLSPAEQSARREERLARIVALRDRGLTTRDIAHAEGISQTQIVRDIASAAGLELEPPGSNLAFRPLERFRRALSTLYRADRDRVFGAIPELLAGPLADRFRQVAERHGVPFEGDRWPAYETLTVVIRDLTEESAGAE